MILLWRLEIWKHTVSEDTDPYQDCPAYRQRELPSLPATGLSLVEFLFPVRVMKINDSAAENVKTAP